MEIRDFLNTLYGGLSGYAVLGTKNLYGELDTERAWGLPRDLNDGRIARYSNIRADQDLYCSVAAFSTPHRSNDDSEAMSNVVWADADEAHPDNFRVPPSIIVATSKDRWHLFWVLDKPVNARVAQEMSRRVYQAHKEQGCDAGWTMTKYLRVPGTKNLKYDEPWSVLAEDTGLRYTLADFEEAYPSDDFDNEAVDHLDRSAPANPELDEVRLLERRIPVDIRHLYTDIPTPGVSWSERAMRLWCDLFRAGFEDHEVFSLALHASCNKYAPAAWGKETQTGVKIPSRANWQDVTWREVLKAKVRVEEERAMPTPVVKDTRIVFNGERPKFINDNERDFIRESPINFLEQYSKIGRKFTGSAPVYHEHLGAMILSSAFGNVAHIDIPFLADKPLNLWGIILGDSTSSRKSTALRLAQDVLAQMDEYTQETTYIGSDITAEGLTKNLTGRHNKPSLVLVDEISGLVESMSSKRYQAGLQERFTELYDGRVPKTLRSTRESESVNQDDVRTCFNFYGAGVRTRLTNLLSIEDFQSGFLMRMTWAVDRRVGYEENSSAIRFQHNHADMDFEATALGRMKAVDDLGSVLASRKAEYASILSDGRMIFLHFDAETEDRFNEWLVNAHRYVKDSGLEFVHSAVERLAMSVMKLACLVHLWARPNDIQEVTLPALLVALKQAENWLYDMLIVASEVTSSSFEDRLNEVEEYLLSQTEYTATDVAIRRKFAGLKPREYTEIMDSLSKQGRVIFDLEKQTYQAFA